MSKKCAPLWCKAHVKVKKCKKTGGIQPFWKLRCRKSARRCGATHSSKSKQSKRTKHTIVGTLLEVEMLKQCAALWREARFQVRMLKTQHARTTFGHQAFSLFEGRRNGFCTSWKVTQTYGFCSFWNRWQRVGHLKNVCKDAFRVAGTVQGTSPSDMLGGQGADCFERDCILEHQIFRFAKMILRDRCSTSYDPHFLLAVAVLQRHWMERSRNALARGHQLCTWLSIYRLRTLRKSQSPRIASFLTLSSSKIEGVSRKVLLFFSLFQLSNSN